MSDDVRKAKNAGARGILPEQWAGIPAHAESAVMSSRFPDDVSGRGSPADGGWENPICIHGDGLAQESHLLPV